MMRWYMLICIYKMEKHQQSCKYIDTQPHLKTFNTVASFLTLPREFTSMLNINIERKHVLLKLRGEKMLLGNAKV